MPGAAGPLPARAEGVALDACDEPWLIQGPGRETVRPWSTASPHLKQVQFSRWPSDWYASGDMASTGRFRRRVD